MNYYQSLLCFLVPLIVYVVYIVIFSKGLKKDAPPLSYVKRTVSVVVAARNEENNISNLLTGLINQSYPSSLYEVVVVNDRSTDATPKIVQRFCEKWDNITLINIDETPDGYSPKKYALKNGIEASKNEIILLTDADCLVNKYWMEAMVSNFADDVDLVAGFSRTKVSNWKKASLSVRFEYFDFLVMFMAAAGAILSGKAFSCSNQNIAYRRDSFYKVGGFEKIKGLISGDDVNLLQLFRKAKMKVRFSMIVHSFVYTKPIAGWLQLLNQRSRWASNSTWQITLNPEFFLYLLSVFTMNALIIITLFYDWRVSLLIFVLKTVSEAVFISKHFDKFENGRERLYFMPVWSIVQPLYVIVVAILGTLGIFSWKPKKR